MRFLTTITFLSLFSTVSFTQIGFNSGYFIQQVPEWEKAVFGERSDESLLTNGYTAGLDYRLAPFESFRIELYPELAYNRANSDNSLGEFAQNRLDFSLKSNIYLLSLKADCDCPTFSREASILEKGFFVQIAPGISYSKANFKNNDLSQTADDIAFKLGLGIGLDIGLSNFITISPIFKYKRYFNADWNGLQDIIRQIDNRTEVQGSDLTNINQLFVGIRLEVRFRE